MKTIFWNVDTQYDFMRDDESFHGALAIPGTIKIEGNLEKLTRIAQEKKILTVNTADWHTEASKEFSDTPDYKTTFPKHCMEFTQGAKYIPATEPSRWSMYIDWMVKDDGFLGILKQVSNAGIDIVIFKDHFDVFQGNPYTERILESIKPEAAVVYGVATNVCVNYAVLGLLERGIRVYVPTDAIKELPGRPLEEVLNKWKEKGARLIKTEEVKNYL